AAGRPEGLRDALVHVPHPAPAQLADRANLAQPIRHGLGRVDLLVLQEPLPPLQLLHHRDRGEQLADGLGVLGIPRFILADRGGLAPPAPLEEVLRHLVEGIAGHFDGGIGRSPSLPRRLGIDHGSPPSKFVSPARDSLRRSRARTYRLLAAAGWMPSTAAVSRLLSSSKCRSARTSRSIGSRPSRACWSWSRVSARCAAWLGEVKSPINSTIRAALAAGPPPRSIGTSRPASRTRAPKCWRWTSTSRWTVTQRSPR